MTEPAEHSVGRRDRAYYKSPEYKRICRARRAERDGRLFRPSGPGGKGPGAGFSVPKNESPALQARRAWAEWLELRAPPWWLARYHAVRKQAQALKDRAKYRRRYEACPEKERARTQRYKDRNPDRVGQWHATRQARLSQQGLEPISNRIISSLFDRKLCPYCDCSLGPDAELDHIIPLARGGRHEARNLVACCPTCNRRKAARAFSDWLPLLTPRSRGLAARMFIRRFGPLDTAEKVAWTA